MASVTANIAKGREVEFYNRVFTNDPANSALIMMLLRTGGSSLSTLQDADTFTAVLALSTEVSVAGYARKTLTDADLSAWAPDDTSNSVSLVLPLQTFAGLAAGQTIRYVVVGYDNDTTGGTDANIVPVTISETLIDGTTIPTLGDDVVVDFSGLWVTAV